MSNPAFNRLEQDARSGYAGFQSPGAPGHPAAAQVGSDYPTQEQLQQMYAQPSAGPVQTDRVTMDDVIMRTLTLFGIVLVTGTAGWLLSAANPSLGLLLWGGGVVGTLVIGLIIAFRKVLSVPLILTYAVFEGLFVGALSQSWNDRYDGLVGQAVLATVATFAGMFLAYKAGWIKVTNKFRRIMVMALAGYAIFALINFGYAMITSQPLGFGGSGGLGIAISVFAVGLAAFTLALDFDQIEYAIATGAPRQYSWLLAHGLIVTLVWLYVEFLRLFARLRD
jgi:uncharacterized YccA/Bax inhibitor family protein